MDRELQSHLRQLYAIQTPGALHEYDILAERHGLNTPGPQICADFVRTAIGHIIHDGRWDVFMPRRGREFFHLNETLETWKNYLSGAMRTRCEDLQSQLTAAFDTTHARDFCVARNIATRQMRYGQTFLACWSLDEGIAYRTIRTGVGRVDYTDVNQVPHGFRLKYQTRELPTVKHEAARYPIEQDTYYIDFRRADFRLGIHDYTLVKWSDVES